MVESNINDSTSGGIYIEPKTVHGNNGQPGISQVAAAQNAEVKIEWLQRQSSSISHVGIIPFTA